MWLASVLPSDDHMKPCAFASGIVTPRSAEPWRGSLVTSSHSAKINILGWLTAIGPLPFKDDPNAYPALGAREFSQAEVRQNRFSRRNDSLGGSQQ